MKKLFCASQTDEILIETEKTKIWKEYLEGLYARHLNENVLKDSNL